MREIVTRIDIDAPARAVWEVLTDFESYGRENWNSYIESIHAVLVSGAPVTAVTNSPRLSRRDLKARILSAEFPELSWEVKLPVPGILYAKHYFRVESLAPNRSRFTQGELVSGLLTGTVFHLVQKSEPGFVILNRALKQRVEALSVDS